MKILHIGLMVNGRREGLCKSFADVSNYREFPISHDLNSKLENLYNEGFKPDIIFQQIHDGILRNGSVTANITEVIKDPLNKWRKEGAFSINWIGDIRNVTPSWTHHHKECTDLQCFSNMRDVKNFDGPSAFLQIGIDPLTFKKWPKNEPVHDVVFMGNHYGSQFPLGGYRQTLVLWLEKKGYAFYGNYPRATGNLQAQPHDPFPMQSQESQIYSSAKIAISLSHYNVERYTSDRLLRCMASHVCTLSHHFEGIERDFVRGQHLDTFRNITELEERINYYLDNETAREAIAKQGHDLVHENYTYDSMVKNIIELAI